MPTEIRNHWKILLFILFITVGKQLSAADINLKGKTLDARNNEVLPYVHVGIVGTTLGTASDHDGSFQLSISDDFKGFEIFVSSVGYETMKIKMDTLNLDGVVEIKLMPILYSLSTLEVDAQSRWLYGLVKDASRKIKENYPTSAYLYNFEFNSQSQVNNTVFQMKSKGELYDSLGYQRLSFFDAMSSRTYRFMNNSYKDKKQYTFYAGITTMDELLNFDIVKTTGNVLDVAHVDRYNLSLEGTTTYRGDSVYVIAYKNLEPSVITTGDYYATSYEGEIYIQKNTLAILKNTTKVTSTKVSRYGRSFVITDGQEPLGTDLTYEFTTTYQPYNGKLILSTVNMQYDYMKDNNKLHNESELIVQGFKAMPVQAVPSRALLKAKR